MYLPLKVNSNSKPRTKCMGDLNPDSLQTDILHHQPTGMSEGNKEEEQTSGFCPSFFRSETGLHYQGSVRYRGRLLPVPLGAYSKAVTN